MDFEKLERLLALDFRTEFLTNKKNLARSLTLPRRIVSRVVFRVKICAEHDAAKIKFKKVEEKIEKCEFLKIVVFFLVKAIIGVVST